MVSRVAAGEVVERPASVVKELAENAIDAGASEVRVEVSGGCSLIVVSDDGCGMTCDELQLAVDWHCTSKLPNNDFVLIETLGFRGEALPSIGAVSRLKLTSLARDREESWSIEVNGGRIAQPKPASHSRGTRVEVRDLFCTLPARLKFLGDPNQEIRRINQTIKRMALGYPEVAFALSASSTQLDLPVRRSVHGALALRARASDIIASDFGGSALEVKGECPYGVGQYIRLHGYLSPPACHRVNSSQQYFFVNGRAIRDQHLQKALRMACAGVLPKDRHPAAVLLLQLPPAAVDVNVHPDKSEVRFADARAVFELVVNAVRKALECSGVMPTQMKMAEHLRPAHLQSRVEPRIPRLQLRSTSEPLHLAEPEGDSHHLARWPGSVTAVTAMLPLVSASAGTEAPLAHKCGVSKAVPSSSPDDRSAQDATNDAQYPLGCAKAQLHRTYVVAQTRQGMVLVDQHAAHERIVFEQLKREFQSGMVERQLVLIPELIPLSDDRLRVMLSSRDELLKLGLVIEPAGGEALIAREVPALLDQTRIHELIQDLADELLEQSLADPVPSSSADAVSQTVWRWQIEPLCARMACHGSVRAGRPLSLDEMNALLRQMELTDHFGQCPHGRPTYVVLTDVGRIFGRH